MKPVLKSVSSEVPDPPYPAETRLAGWKLELDMPRIEDSDTWTLASAEQRPWLLMTWYRAWSCMPTGSMPEDLDVFAAKLGCTREFLEANRKILLKHWTLHSDGRLYHPYISGLVNEMLGRRKASAERVRKHRETKGGGNALHGVTNALPSVTYANDHDHDYDDKDSAYGGCASAAPKHPQPAAESTEKKKSGPCPYAKIRELWVRTLPCLPQPLDAEDWTAARKAKIRALWRDQLPSLEDWEKTFGYVRDSPFLTGREHAPNRKPFQATLWWVADTENLSKIYEGKYDA